MAYLKKLKPSRKSEPHSRRCVIHLAPHLHQGLSELAKAEQLTVDALATVLINQGLGVRQSQRRRA